MSTCSQQFGQLWAGTHVSTCLPKSGPMFSLALSTGEIQIQMEAIDTVFKIKPGGLILLCLLVWDSLGLLLLEEFLTAFLETWSLLYLTCAIKSFGALCCLKRDLTNRLKTKQASKHWILGWESPHMNFADSEIHMLGTIISSISLQALRRGMCTTSIHLAPQHNEIHRNHTLLPEAEPKFVSVCVRW